MSAFFDDIKNDKKSAVNDFLIYIGYPFPDDLIRMETYALLAGSVVLFHFSSW